MLVRLVLLRYQNMVGAVLQACGRAYLLMQSREVVQKEQYSKRGEYPTV
jgi:hypothetical protein